ncbi:Rid family hydrolase [Rhodophyticola porphyridii]|uniref:Rid family hydrolase n=1 Tax=Rhodophyticola porphyridii TaxID=1852017 RepID=UPI0035CF2109
MIRRIRSGSAFEDRFSYCRAVVAGGTVYVAGSCAHSDYMPTDIVGQCASALRVVDAALRDAGTELQHVVRVVYYLTDIGEFEDCAPLLRDAFGAHPPAASIIEAKLIDPADRIEIEVTAVLPSQAPLSAARDSRV